MGAVEKKPNKDLKGIGGWLLVYVILLGFNILYSPIILIRNYIDPKININIVYILTAVISWVLSISIFILIFTKKAWVPKYIVTIIWFLFVFSLTSLSGVKFNTTSALEETGILVGMFISIFISFIFTIIWTFYFLKSKRVKNTFVN